jgi:hypothetical protein
VNKFNEIWLAIVRCTSFEVLDSQYRFLAIGGSDPQADTEPRQSKKRCEALPGTAKPTAASIGLVPTESSGALGKRESTYWGNIMKKLAIIAFAAASTLAFAGPPSSSSGPQIEIKGTSLQTTTTSFLSSVTNEAVPGSYAVQNVSSNGGNVTIDGWSSQTTNVGAFGSLTNKADGKDAYAAQNVASNSGQVDVSGTSIQMAMIGGLVSNKAGAGATAVQNMSSNNGCSACEPGSGKKPGY